MGSGRSKPVAESARSVIAKKNELIAKEKAAAEVLKSIPGLSGKNPSVSSRLNAETQQTMHPKTGDVNPDVHFGLSKLDFVKMSSDTNFSKYKLEMETNPQASVVREKEMKMLIMEQKNKGIFDGLPLKAPGKVSESELITLFQKLKQGMPISQGSLDYGIDEAQIKLIVEKCIYVPEIVQETNSEGTILVAR